MILPDQVLPTTKQHSLLCVKMTCGYLDQNAQPSYAAKTVHKCCDTECIAAQHPWMVVKLPVEHDLDGPSLAGSCSGIKASNDVLL